MRDGLVVLLQGSYFMGKSMILRQTAGQAGGTLIDPL
jgi:hypothetical protein